MRNLYLLQKKEYKDFSDLNWNLAKVLLFSCFCPVASTAYPGEKLEGIFYVSLENLGDTKSIRGRCIPFTFDSI